MRWLGWLRQRPKTTAYRPTLSHSLTGSRERAEFIVREVLPRVNEVLAAADRTELQTGKLRIQGSGRVGVEIFDPSGTIDWIAPLLLALRAPTYKGCAVRLIGWANRRTSHGRPPRRIHERLDTANSPVRDATRFLERYGDGYFCVEVRR